MLTHPVWCRPCMLRECPFDHQCMRGVAPSVPCSPRRAGRCEPARRVSGSRRHDDRRRRLSRRPRTRRLTTRGASKRSDAQPRRHRGGGGYQSVGDRARLFQRGRGRCRRIGGSTRVSRSAARAWTRITIVRIIRPGACADFARACDCRKPGRGMIERAARYGIDADAVVQWWATLAGRRPRSYRWVRAVSSYTPAPAPPGRRARRPASRRMRWSIIWRRPRRGF